MCSWCGFPLSLKERKDQNECGSGSSIPFLGLIVVSSGYFGACHVRFVFLTIFMLVGG